MILLRLSQEIFDIESSKRLYIFFGHLSTHIISISRKEATRTHVNLCSNLATNAICLSVIQPFYVEMTLLQLIQEIFDLESPK